MTCRKAQKHLVDLLDSARTPEADELLRHLASCATCSSEYAEIQAAVAAIEPPLRIHASPNFKERVMSEILSVQREPARRIRYWPRLAVAGLAALALVALVPFIGEVTGGRSAAGLLAQSVQAMASVRSLHLVARMRTSSTENFDFAGPRAGFQTIEIWKEYGNSGRWRVEKPEQTVVMDGRSTLLYAKPAGFALRGPASSQVDDPEWLGSLLQPNKILTTELHAVRTGSAEIQRALEETREGVRELVVTVTSKGQPGAASLPVRSITMSAHKRIYRFDAATKRLTGMQIVVPSERGEVPIFEVTAIRYDDAIAPNLFALAVPPDVVWGRRPEEMPAPAVALGSAKEAVVMFLDAFAREDWPLALKMFRAAGIPPFLQEKFGGLQVLSMGEASRFEALGPGYWRVPCEIRLKNGNVVKTSFGVTNNNSAHRWIYDSGF